MAFALPAPAPTFLGIFPEREREQIPGLVFDPETKLNKSKTNEGETVYHSHIRLYKFERGTGKVVTVKPLSEYTEAELDDYKAYVKFRANLETNVKPLFTELLSLIFGL